MRRMNDKAYWYLFDDKATFNELFKEEVGRGWMKLSPDTDPEAFKALLCEGVGRGKAYGLGLMTIIHRGGDHG